MRVALLCSRMRVEEKLLRDALTGRGVEVDIVDDRDLVLALGSPRRAWDVVLERSLAQTHGLAALRIFESWGVATVNRHSVVALCASKLDTSARLLAEGVPTPVTAIAFSADAALRAVEQIGYPVVLKPVTGSWGRLLARINDRDAAEALFEHKTTLGGPEHSIFYLQRHVNKPSRDIRAFVVGDEVICAIHRRSEHWITNTARGATTSDCPVTDGLRSLCLRAAAAVGGGVLAVDVLEDDDALLVTEINATMEFRNSIEVTGIDIPARVADFVCMVGHEAMLGVGA